MKKLTLVLAASAAFAATPVMAQDTDSGGLFVGATAGYDTINLEAAGTDEDDSGVFYGLVVGYDVDAGAATIGLEAEVSDTSISDEVGETGLDIYGGVRLGYEMDANDVIYIKAGYTNVDVDLTDNLEGVRVGGGFEHNFGGFVGRLEYRYSNYNVSDVLMADINGNRHQIGVTLGARF